MSQCPSALLALSLAALMCLGSAHAPNGNAKSWLDGTISLEHPRFLRSNESDPFMGAEAGHRRVQRAVRATCGNTRPSSSANTSHQ